MSDTVAAQAPVYQQTTPAKHCNTRDRLFGVEPIKASPKRITPTFKSQIFDTTPSPQRTPKKSIAHPNRNPVTGEIKEAPAPKPQE